MFVYPNWTNYTESIMMSRRKQTSKRKSSASKSSTTIGTTSTKIISGKLIRPDVNRRIQFVQVPIFAPVDPRSLIARTEVGSFGPYKITFVLAIPGRSTFLDELDLPTLMLSGESNILAETDFQIETKNETGTWVLDFTCNKRNQVSTVSARVHAQNFEDAERWAYNNITPLLSFWSYQYDVGIDIAGYEVLEEITQTQKWVFGVVGKRRTLDLTQGSIPKIEYRRLLAAYREAMNSTNIFYQTIPSLISGR